MKKTLLSIFIVLTGVLGAQEKQLGVDQFNFLTPQEKQTLIKSGQVIESASSFAELRWAEKTPWKDPVISFWKNKPTTLTAESITLVNLPKQENQSLQGLKIFNAMNQVSTMKGLLYWSVTRKRWEPLILDSYRVDSSNNPHKIADQTFDQIPANYKITVYQKDNKFGDGYYEITIQKTMDGFFVVMKNLSTLNFGILPLVDPSNLTMTFSIVVTDTQALVHTVMGAKTASFFGLEKSKDESFKNRMSALAQWFVQKVQ